MTNLYRPQTKEEVIRLAKSKLNSETLELLLKFEWSTHIAFGHHTLNIISDYTRATFSEDSDTWLFYIDDGLIGNMIPYKKVSEQNFVRYLKLAAFL